MKRYLPSIRTGGRSRADRERDQFLRELSREGEKLLRSLSQQYLQDLNTQSAQLLQALVAGTVNTGANATQNGTNLMSHIGQLFATSAKYLAARPRTHETSYESARSQEVEARFRLSQAQLLAEAGTTMSKGNKNL